MSLTQFVNRAVTGSWYKAGFSWTCLMLPLSWVFQLLAQRRKKKYHQQRRWQSPVPVIVVGNITVGGTGKTPVVSALVNALQKKGHRPGIVSRGFGVKAGDNSVSVTPASDPALVGDEPVMLARQLQVPLIVNPDRVQAVQDLLAQSDCDLVITDDGLQHYNLQRDIEILVLDGERMLGNGLCLPAGPLREPPERMRSVDIVLVNGNAKRRLPTPAGACQPSSFYLQPDQLMPVNPGLFEHSAELAPKPTKVHAVAGIGNPQRFFNTLSKLGYEVLPHAFPDHHDFSANDIDFDDDLPVIMTAKDAVKCQPLANQRHWYLPVTACLPEETLESIYRLIEKRTENSCQEPV